MRKALCIALMAIAAIGFAAAGAQQESKKGDAMMAKDDMAKDMFDLAGLGSSVAHFTTEDDAMSLAKNAKVVYFFAATWCPTCKATYNDIRTNFASIPKEYKILFVNYDKAKDLKTKFGVTYQHTFVLLDGMGKSARTWSGTATVADIIKNASAM